MKSKYITPTISIFSCVSENILDVSANTETCPFNPAEGTNEALSNGSNIWGWYSEDDKGK